MFDRLFDNEPELTWEDARDAWFKLRAGETAQDFGKTVVNNITKVDPEGLKNAVENIRDGLTVERSDELAITYDNKLKKVENGLTTASNDIMGWILSLKEDERAFISGYALGKNVHMIMEYGAETIEIMTKMINTIAK